MKRVRLKDIDLLTIEQVADALKVSVHSVRRYVRSNEFPPPVRLSETVVRWRVTQVYEWIEERQQLEPYAPRRQSPKWLNNGVDHNRNEDA